VYGWPPLFSYFLFIWSLLIVKLQIFPYTCSSIWTICKFFTVACSKCTVLVTLALHASAVWWHSWPHIDITPFSRTVTCTFLASPFFYSKNAFWMGYQLFFQSRPLWNQLVWWGCAYNHRNKINSWKIIFSQSESLMIWILWYMVPTTTKPFTESSKQVRFCNNMDDTCTEMNLNLLELAAYGVIFQQYFTYSSSYYILVSI